MSLRFEQYKEAHLPTLKGWWTKLNEAGPEAKMIPETSYLMYHNNEPILFISLYMTNASVIWLDNLIGNPDLKGSDRRTCGQLFLSYIDNVAKSHGKDRFFCMSINEKTSARYVELGFTKTLDNVSTFVRGVN